MIKIKLCGIYKIEHISGYYYLGLSKSILDRWQSHYTDIKISKHSSTELQNLFKSTRIEDWTFSILEHISVSDLKKEIGLKGLEFDKYLRRHLLNREKWWMSQYSVNFSLNKNNKNFK
jgi:hypothetical protein